MKTTIVLATLLISTTTFASTFQNVKALTYSSLNSAASAITSLDGVYASSLKKVVVLKASGKTAQEQRQNTMAQAAHTLCGFFDDGVAIGLDSTDAKGSKNAAETFLSNNIEDEKEVVLKTVTALNGKNGIEVYSGDASGNNTAGSILGFYDTKNNEIAVFANTNCGSDD